MVRDRTPEEAGGGAFRREGPGTQESSPSSPHVPAHPTPVPCSLGVACLRPCWNLLAVSRGSSTRQAVGSYQKKHGSPSPQPQWPQSLLAVAQNGSEVGARKSLITQRLASFLLISNIHHENMNGIPCLRF